MALGPLAIPLQQIARCFQGVVPANLTTVSIDGVPNIVSLSDIHLVDDRHVAASRQFFRKTQANLAANPRARLVVTDPATHETYRLAVRFDHEETAGPLFSTMTERLAAVASMSGMSGVFHLQAVTVFEVLAVEPITGMMRDLPAPAPSGVASFDAATQVGALRRISDCLRATDDAEKLLDSVLATLGDVLGFQHSLILLLDEKGQRLFTVASRGYPESGVGAEVRMGDGIIGAVAHSRRLMRISSVTNPRLYGRASRGGEEGAPLDEIALPGLRDAESHLALPLLVQDDLLGVLAVESRQFLAYGEADEAFLDVVAGQVAVRLHDLLRRSDEPAAAATHTRAPIPKAHAVRRFLFYPSDDCVFLDGHYLIRNLPGRVLWTLLRAHIDEGRSEFTNRELRLDPAIGLPSSSANLESRLILLRRRLAEKCPDVGLVSCGRGRFKLDVHCPIELAEKR
jgi:hypothetical protein